MGDGIRHWKSLNEANSALHSRPAVTAASVFLPSSTSAYLSVPTYAIGGVAGEATTDPSNDTIASGPSVGIAVAAMVGLTLLIVALVICAVRVCGVWLCCAPCVSVCCCGRGSTKESPVPDLTGVGPAQPAGGASAVDVRTA